MAWVETASASFQARHAEADTEDARGVLLTLERSRDQLAGLFPRTADGLTVVLHGTAVGLTLTNPLLPLTWLATAPAARRYVAGWAAPQDLHVLSPAALRARAANIRGSREMLQRSAACLYARRVITLNNPDLVKVMGLIRGARAVRWAWLLEGSARWFGGQTEHARPTIARRLRDGRRPSFPPGLRDAPLLGATVIDLLARQEGERAAARFCCRLHPEGPAAALTRALRGRDLASTEAAWRSHLERLAGAA